MSEFKLGLFIDLDFDSSFFLIQKSLLQKIITQYSNKKLSHKTLIQISNQVKKHDLSFKQLSNFV